MVRLNAFMIPIRLLAPMLMIAFALVVAVRWDDTPRSADLVVVNRGEVFTLDPQRMSYMQDFRMAYALYEPLVRCDNADMSIQPAAAELPELSEDRRTYTFRMRSDAKWSNGDPVTAHDFAYAWRRLLLPDTAADYSNLFFEIEGAAEFFAWRNEQLAEFAKSRNENSDAARSAEAGPAGAEELFAATERRFEDTVGIRALDDRSLQVTLRRPVPYFLDLLCFGPAFPVHRPTVEGWPNAAALIDAERGWKRVVAPPWNQRAFVALNPATGRLKQRHEWARAGSLVSNGPYVLTQWRYKRDLRLERNPYFHSPELLRNDSVLLLSIDDANTAVMAFEAGEIDWLADVGVEYQADMLAQQARYVARHRTELDGLLHGGMSYDEALAALPAPQADERRNMRTLPTFGTDFVSFNCRAKLADGRANPFADARVRRAFAMAVDKKAIVEVATRMNEPVANTLIPVGSIPGYNSPAGLPMDRARATIELAAAGWRNRNGSVVNDRGEAFPEIDLLYNVNSARYKWMCLELQSQWQAALGVKVTPRGVDTKFFSEDLVNGKFMIARGRWYGDYGDPTTFLDISKTGDGNNDRGFSDARFDAMLSNAADESDPAARLRILEEAERYLMEDQLPLMPVCQLVQTYMYQPGPQGLRGLTNHPRLMQYLWQMQAN